MQYQWYPGHMAKARRQMQEDMKFIDVVVELVDARIPYSSKNPDIDKIAKGKARVLLLNKSDMADQKATVMWKNYYEKQGFYVVPLNSRNGSGVKLVSEKIMEACKEKIERDRKRGIQNRPVRAMIVGIPNVGKSTFINSFAGKAAAKTGNKPGVTKGKQWIRLNAQVELLDTPGILWPKFEDNRVGKCIGWIGSINDEILEPSEMALDLINYIRERYPEVLPSRFGIEIAEEDTGLMIYDNIAKKRGCLKKGGELDYERAGRMIVDEVRSCKLGNLSFELPMDVSK